jgi:hypothetical protein
VSVTSQSAGGDSAATGFDDLEDALFDIEAPPPVSLADKFGVPPVSVLDRRSGEWQDRKRKWLSMGMQSELGRDAAALHVADDKRNDFLAQLARGEAGNGIGALAAGGVSVFDPVLCELAYRWHTPPGARILDPFAGGSVRGIVASTLGRWYDGIELRPEQVAANRSQAHLGSDITPRWVEGDSADLTSLVDGDYDLVFTCPPYADLEVYSDDPRDLSTMPYDDFLTAYTQIIHDSLRQLRPDRFAVWVVSDVRDRRGAYRGLVADTIRAFTSGGAAFHNEAIVLDQVGMAAVRAERPFRATRKLTRVHQHMLVFVKGDAKRAAAYAAGGAA